MSARHVSSAASAIVACLALAACSADAPSADAPSQSAAPSSQSATVTTTTTPPATPTSPATATTHVATTTVPAATTTAPPSTLALAPALVWADEFNDPAGTRPDPSRWAFDIGGTGWGNRQLEYYTDTNAATDGEGHLLVTSRPLDVTTAPSCWYGACHFESSRLTTAGLASWQYGRFEIRAAFPSGEATWPAFWMLGADFAEVGWPASGEIDVVEHVGRDGNVVRGTAHGPGYSEREGATGSVDVGTHQEFHTYAVEWGPTSIVWFVDGNEYHRLDRSDDRQWVFDKEFYLVLNLAVGGLLGGEPGPIDFELQTLAVDYVRVYAP